MHVCLCSSPNDGESDDFAAFLLNSLAFWSAQFRGKVRTSKCLDTRQSIDRALTCVNFNDDSLSAMIDTVIRAIITVRRW